MSQGIGRKSNIGYHCYPVGICFKNLMDILEQAPRFILPLDNSDHPFGELCATNRGQILCKR